MVQMYVHKSNTTSSLLLMVLQYDVGNGEIITPWVAVAGT